MWDCRQPKNQGMGTAMTAQDEEDMPGDDGTVQQEARGFSVEEPIVGQTVSPVVMMINVK